MSGNRKFYEAMARREDTTVVSAEDVVANVISIDDVQMLGHDFNGAFSAWTAFNPMQTCNVCSRPTSPRVLANFGGVCNRCHYQHRWN